MSVPTSFPAGFTTARFALKNAISRSSCRLPVAIKPSPSPTWIRAMTTAVRIATHGERRMDRFGMRSAPKERRVEVIAIGAELDAVLRADLDATALGGGGAGEGDRRG